MARSIRYALGCLAVLALATVGARAQPPAAPGVEQNAVIVLPSDVNLPAGQYPAVLDAAGRKITTRVIVRDAGPARAAAPAGGGAPATEAAPAANTTTTTSPPGGAAPTPWLSILLPVLATGLLVGAGVWAYAKIYAPRKQVKPYHEALALVSAGRYDEALPLLTRVESKLPDKLRRDARFFIAFSNYKLGNPKDAEHVLSGLHRENPEDAPAAYLLAHVRAETGQYDEAERVLSAMEKHGQLGLHHAKKLFGLVQFHRALAALKEGHVDGAAELFEKVAALGDFADQIPADLRNRHIALGTKALFDKDYAEARKQFEALEKAAPREGEHKRDTMMVTAQLGLALAAWVEDNPEAEQRVETHLVAAARLLDPDGPLESAWPDAGEEKGLAERLAELGAEPSAEERLPRHNLRDIHFLRGMSVLRSSLRLEQQAALEQLDEHYERALARFARARHYDDQFSDVPLVVGLLMYYVHKPGARERTGAVALLEEARKQGMHEPNAMEIINNRARIEQANADAVDLYLQVLDKYLHDDTVRAEVRRGLYERVGRYRKVSKLGPRVGLGQMRRVEPTVAEVCSRSEILRARVEQIVSGQTDAEGVGNVRRLSDEILRDGQKLYEQAMAIEKSESELLALTGAQLFRDQ